MRYSVPLVLTAGLQINMHAQRTAIMSETKILKVAPCCEKSVGEMDSLKVQLPQEVREDQGHLKSKLNTFLLSNTIKY